MTRRERSLALATMFLDFERINELLKLAADVGRTEETEQEKVHGAALSAQKAQRKQFHVQTNACR